MNTFLNVASQFGASCIEAEQFFVGEDRNYSCRTDAGITKNGNIENVSDVRKGALHTFMSVHGVVCHD
jgi:hypothetical protein